MPRKTGTLLFAVLFCLSAALFAQERLILATTTSTDNSGLLAELHAQFEALHGIAVSVIAVGTGKALRLGENGDVDAVLVHAPAVERRFVANGYGLERLSVMHNDFVILGPPDDPAGLKTADTLDDALRRLIHAKHYFVSRGDDSGTHKKELTLWRTFGQRPDDERYLSAGQGMGAVLQITNDKGAYTLSDRGTYLAYAGKIHLVPVFENDPTLFNPYHLIIVNPERHPHVKIDLAKKYAEFVRGEVGQSTIRSFIKHREPLFKPDVIP